MQRYSGWWFGTGILFFHNIWEYSFPPISISIYMLLPIDLHMVRNTSKTNTKKGEVHPRHGLHSAQEGITSGDLALGSRMKFKWEEEPRGTSWDPVKSIARSRSVGVHITPISLWFLLVCYIVITSYHYIIYS